MEGLSIREMECHIDINMLLDGYAGWEVGSPHCTPSSSMKCSCMHCRARAEGGRTNGLPGAANDMASQSCTHRQMFLLSD